MATSDAQAILLTHDRWATQQILDACAGLSEEEFHRRFEMGPGSLHDTVTHMLGAMRTWTQTLAGEEPGPRLEQGGKRSVGELKELLEECARGLEREAHRLPVGETITRVREGKAYQFTRGAVLTHVATHGMHHRAQCLNMLRQVGVKTLPMSSVAEWARVADVG
ncbi:MAG TPA: DinB family protein [Tepidisphaeraceae bacterium]|nr:DinB family protein [Tepidisphaeraceae bacterium]